MESIENTVVDWQSEENYLFLNPRFAEEIHSHYNRIFKETTYRHGIKGHIAFLTSGTTVADQRAYKMVFISKTAFLASAQSVTKTLMIKPTDIWAQCLPRFHVGGLAIEARAHVGGFQIVKFNQPWSAKAFGEFIEQTKATWTSLVPTQIYDLVKENIQNPNPKDFRVLVGGARLLTGLQKQAKDLGWTLMPSYGMTEAGSTIAFIENETLKPFPHVQLDVIDGKLAIKTAALFSFYAQVIKGQIEIKKPYLRNGGFFQTEDFATKMGQGIMLAGRGQDIVKVSGELVAIPKLRDLLFNLGTIEKAHSYYLMAVPDQRLENKIVLMIQKDLLNNDKVKQESYQLAPTFKHSLGEFQNQVLPFEKIRNVYVVDRIPRNDMGKVQEKLILQMIEKGEAYEIREHRVE